MNDYVARRIADVGWIAADTETIIACGTDEPEIIAALEQHLGRSVPKLEESPVEAFEATLRLAVANRLTQDRELFAAIIGQVAQGESNTLQLKDVVGLLSQEVRSLTQKNDALEREKRRSEKAQQFTNYLTAMGIGPQQLPEMLTAMLAKEGLT